ncbi:hypothetical protein CLV92_114105 [Kineococcus xinjiangensis]|uniref:Uncharacterized protein n=1 Tax=Kineococcus xinjiangensis TaxID=512762 RepID=A0A2S6IE55_9ACTN|nr:hypothetical protein CLV92_114105 [Kineococcus xinjiangensis]
MYVLYVFTGLWLVWLVYYLIQMTRWERDCKRLIEKMRHGFEPELDPDGSGLRMFHRAPTRKAEERARKKRARKSRFR